MRLGFMQPYFLPWPGHFALIAHTDRWVVFDDAQMIRHGWVDRNRVLHPTEGWQYIKVPTKKHSRGTPIREVVASPHVDWRQRLLRKLAHYRRAPQHAAVWPWLETTLAAAPDNIAELNLHVLTAVCRFLELPFHPVRHSELDYDRTEVQGPGDWAPVVAGHLGASLYLNPSGGAQLFDERQFATRSCALRFLQWSPEPYPQLRPGFEPGLSILDMMMMVPVGKIRAALDAGVEHTQAELAAQQAPVASS